MPMDGESTLPSLPVLSLRLTLLTTMVFQSSVGVFSFPDPMNNRLTYHSYTDASDGSPCGFEADDLMNANSNNYLTCDDTVTPATAALWSVSLYSSLLMAELL